MLHMQVQVCVQCPTKVGEALLLLGGHTSLGDWDVSQAAPMTWGEGHVWTTELELPSDCTSLSFKVRHAVLVNCPCMLSAVHHLLVSCAPLIWVMMCIPAVCTCWITTQHIAVCTWWGSIATHHDPAIVHCRLFCESLMAAWSGRRVITRQLTCWAAGTYLCSMCLLGNQQHGRPCGIHVGSWDQSADIPSSPAVLSGLAIHAQLDVVVSAG